MGARSMRNNFGILLAVVLAIGCGGAVDRTLTWDEFRSQAYREADTGVYVVNGDEVAETDEQLAEVYARYVRDREMPRGMGQSEGSLIVNRVGGQDDKWSAATAANITYCISSSSFGSRHSAVVNAMNSAAGAWEAAANVNFVHSSSQDGNCTKNNSSVVFDVRQVCTGQYLARAFFPSSKRRSREILIDCTSFGNISPWTLAGVLRHELGHTIGFRHEHTRPESGTCFEDNNWRALTAYDSSSVMHYPQCNGSQTGDLVLTSLDKDGAAALYP